MAVTGADIVLGGATGAAALLLLLAGVGHVRERRLFAATLTAQRVLPRALHGPVAAVMGPAEVLLGAAMLAGLVAGGGWARAAAVPTAVLYLAFGVYVAVVWRTRPRVPCGCFGNSSPASGSTVARALVLGAAAAAVAVRGVPSAVGVDGVMVAGAALVLGGAFWLLPLLTE